MIRIAIASIAIVFALAGATFSFRAQAASCLTLAQAKIETAQWQAVKVIEPVKIRTVAVEPAARERFDVVFYGGADRLQFERRWIRWGRPNAGRNRRRPLRWRAPGGAIASSIELRTMTLLPKISCPVRRYLGRRRTAYAAALLRT